MQRKEKTTVLCVLFLVVVWAMASMAEAAPAPFKITPQWKEKMKALMPATPSETPKKSRKVLLFSLTTGYNHWVIPHTSEIIKMLAEKTGAFEVVETRDVNMFEREKLSTFDGVILNNNCSKGARRNIFLDVLEKEPKKAAQLEKNLIDFVAQGKGLTAIHGAIVILNNSKEFSALLGGSFDFHPAQQEVTLNLVEPDHRLCKAFKGKPLVHVDEPYLFKGAYKEKQFRPLLVMDTGRLKCGNRQKQVQSDIRYCAWIKPYKKGRVFYCSPSHNAQSFEDPRLLQFLLDGFQYTLGDLKCDDSVKKKMK